MLVQGYVMACHQLALVSIVIFSLPLIQEGQLSVSGEIMCTMYTSTG